MLNSILFGKLIKKYLDLTVFYIEMVEIKLDKNYYEIKSTVSIV